MIDSKPLIETNTKTKATITRLERTSKLKKILKSRLKKINIVRNMIKKGI